jgi:hypothetical protein
MDGQLSLELEMKRFASGMCSGENLALEERMAKAAGAGSLTGELLGENIDIVDDIFEDDSFIWAWHLLELMVQDSERLSMGHSSISHLRQYGRVLCGYLGVPDDCESSN